MISTTYDPGFLKKFGHLTKSVIFHSEVCRKKAANVRAWRCGKQGEGGGVLMHEFSKNFGTQDAREGR